MSTKSDPSTTQHTPGAWGVYASQNDHGETTVICTNDGFSICRIESPAWNTKAKLSPEQINDRANARLIAAAPELAPFAEAVGKIAREFGVALVVPFIERKGDRDAFEGTAIARLVEQVVRRGFQLNRVRRGDGRVADAAKSCGNSRAAARLSPRASTTLPLRSERRRTCPLLS